MKLFSWVDNAIDGNGKRYYSDCDDSDSTIHPGAIESCNGTDDNCNGVVDEGCSIRPGLAVLAFPSGTIQDSVPIYSWNEAHSATWYRLFVWNDAEKKVHAQWYETSEICSGGNCSVTTVTEFNGGNYEWYIKSWNDYGKIWSDGMSFSVSE